MNFFDSKNLDVLLDLHNESEQIKRQEKFSEVAIKIRNKIKLFDSELKKMTTTKGYEVTLENCTCRDFQIRHKPCKHMYKLANKLKIFVRKNGRSRELAADFSKGYADGWKFIVRPCNFADLDIYYSNLLAEGEKSGKNSNKDLILTQGKRFNFKRGEIFFDNVIAYEEVWEKSLQELNYCLQIDSVIETEGSNIPEIIFEDEKFVSQLTAIYGTVDFTIYKNDLSTTGGFEKVKNYSCRQDEFVELLKTGNFADLNGEIHKIC